MILKNLEIAVLIPCYNEQTTIEQVILAFQKVLPSAKIYVYDNNSSDNTIKVALNAGATVFKESLQGKGNVVRRMFADLEADVYVLVDGDATYEASCAPLMIEHLIKNSVDMVNAARVTVDKLAYRAGHSLGNKLLSKIVSIIFSNRFKDMLSGYRVFSRRFVKSFPISSEGFEIETELTIHALALNMPVLEIEAPYYARPPESFSKLLTFKDGYKIMWTIVSLVKKEKPLFFFSIFAAVFALISLILATPLFITYFNSGLVPRFPTAILSASLMILSFLSLTCGLILDTVTHGRKEAKWLHYLSFKAPHYLELKNVYKEL